MPMATMLPEATVIIIDPTATFSPFADESRSGIPAYWQYMIHQEEGGCAFQGRSGFVESS